MPVEFTHAELEGLIAAELSRYDIGLESGQHVARDRAADEVIRASDHAGLLRKIAIACDRLDLSARPRINGSPVLVAEVHAEGQLYTWSAFDASGRKFSSTRYLATRDAALLALNERYDD